MLIYDDLQHILQYIVALSDLPEPATLKRLIDALRIKGDEQAINARIDEFIDLLQENPDYGVGLATFILNLSNQYRQISLYTEIGIASDNSFFYSMNRLIGHRFLPLLPETDSMVELMAYLFDHADDEEWLARIDNDKLHTLAGLIKVDDQHLDLVANAKNSILNAIIVLSYRISGMGLHPDLMKAYPQILNYSAAFVAQNQEAVQFVDAYRRLHELDALTDTKPEHDIDPAPLLVMLEQCADIATNIRKRIYKTGISIRMTNMLVRLEQSIGRMHTLIQLLSADSKKQDHAIITLTQTVIHTAKSRYSFGSLLEINTKLLSRKVTENASRVGEHYISTDKAGYKKMYKKAAIGGFLIAFMATIKTLSYHLALAPIGRAFVNSMIYGLGFVSIHIVRGTVATKQPAMTAAAIASTISEGAGKKTQQLTKLSELIVDIMRTQFIAILGNISIAMPVAFLIAFAWGYHFDTPMIDGKMAGHLLHELNPITSLALPHAAIAGCFLFLSGLISGYYDNLAAYNKIGERLRHHPFFIRILPKSWLEKGSVFIENNLGAIMGNFIFGCFLGSTATIGYMLGLPLDIRHIAFASANFVHGLYFLSPENLTWQLITISFIGVLLIGFVNLMVSFSLALMVALRAKEVDVFEWQRLGRLVFSHFLKHPLDFIIPRRETVTYSRINSDGEIIYEDTGDKDTSVADGSYVVRRLSNKKKQESKHSQNEEHHNTTPLPKPDKPPQLPK